MTYSVKYKQPGDWYWRKLKKVIGDGMEQNFRWFQLQDGTLIHLPYFTSVIFCSDRLKAKAKAMSKESGIKIETPEFT